MVRGDSSVPRRQRPAGRLMVPLFLMAKGLLQRPNFYLSEYLERFREDYYRNLLGCPERRGLGPVASILPHCPREAGGRQHRESETDSRALRRQEGLGGEDDPLAARGAVPGLHVRSAGLPDSDLAARSGVPRPTALRILRVLRIAGCCGNWRRAGVATPRSWRSES